MSPDFFSCNGIHWLAHNMLTFSHDLCRDMIPVAGRNRNKQSSSETACVRRAPQRGEGIRSHAQLWWRAQIQTNSGRLFTKRSETCVGLSLTRLQRLFKFERSISWRKDETYCTPRYTISSELRLKIHIFDLRHLNRLSLGMRNMEARAS